MDACRVARLIARRLVQNGFPRTHDIADSPRIQDRMADCQTMLEEFEDRTIFMSMFIDVGWTERKKQTMFFRFSISVGTSVFSVS